jgi:hypothetical protein
VTRHCDDYIDDPAAPAVLRAFLVRARSPAHGLLSPVAFPKLFATYEGERYRVTMASRMGDVGISKTFNEDHGYELRVAVAKLTDFSDVP